MYYSDNKAKDVKIAYIGGGSRGWAWGLMSDLAACDKMSGRVDLYDIDFEAAQKNEIIGNKYNSLEDCKSQWNYKAVKTIGEALTGADFVVISIIPGTFDEMESDVHAPEKYGIYQPVGDTTGPGGIIRALRTIPMFEEIGLAIKEFAPDAWVINYTNPMALCVRTLFDVFPEIKAFGCCHEVFGTQKLLARALDDICGIKDVTRTDMSVSVIGINHFTWLTKANYRNIDIFDIYPEFVEKYANIGIELVDGNWMNGAFATAERVKFDLFRRFGLIAAAGDRHLAEFCPGKWYLESPQMVKDWSFALTTVAWRKKDLKDRLAKSEALLSGEQNVEIKETGEEGVKQMCALLGLGNIVTNVNIPNRGQISNLPLGAVVETNAAFTTNSVESVYAGNVPPEIYPLVSRVCGEQELVFEAAKKRDLEIAFKAFVNDPLVTIPIDKARALFDEMIENTKKYLTMYEIQFRKVWLL